MSSAARAPESAPLTSKARSGYDAARRRASLRHGRERGCWVYIPASELETTGIDPTGPPPYYRVWGGPRRGVLISLYERNER